MAPVRTFHPPTDHSVPPSVWSRLVRRLFQATHFFGNFRRDPLHVNEPAALLPFLSAEFGGKDGLQSFRLADLFLAKGSRHMFAFLKSRMRTVLSAVFCLVMALVLPAVAQTPEPFDLPVEKLAVMAGGKKHSFTVEVAANDIERGRGLMYRTEMAEDAGMLFVFDGEGDRYFWMKDTPLSLDIIFISASGDIVRIADNTTPFSEKIIPSRAPAKYVLEVLAGTSKRLGFAEGDKVVSPSIVQAD